MTMAPADHLAASALDDVQHAFRAAMSHVAAAVSVVTVLEDGVPHGTTVSAFMSLSMEPPMMLVSLDARSSLLTRVRLGSRVGVNVLADGQSPVATRFATKGGDRFAELAWQVEDGAPALRERHAWVALDVDRLVPAGDHVLVLGHVRAAETGTAHPRPLTYWRRAFGTHS
ncbi:flavin reductase family protein [Mumia sp. zg.B17]|nr:flavin reductase family protein [Mumia sp. zg.B17]